MNATYEELMLPLLTKLGKDEHAARLIEQQEEIVLARHPLPKQVPSQTQISILHERSITKLRQDLLAHIYVQNHSFFENLIIDVLLTMGYGGRRRDLSRRLGCSHDGGIDGIIAQDELGLDFILLQAKRLKPNGVVAVSQVRDFAGSLEAHKAAKGVFVTTGTFTAAAAQYVDAVSRRIVLINGQSLADLMIRHGIGVKVVESYQFKKLDTTYFNAFVPTPSSEDNISASNHPRR